MSKSNLLESERIILRAPEPADLDLLFEWENDTSLWEISNTRIPFSRHILSKYIENAGGDIFEQKQVRLIIEEKGGKPIGAVDLFEIDFFHQRAGVGIMILPPEKRNRGYATDALKILEDYALQIVGLRQLYASVREDNTNSIGLFRKAGYELTGTRKKWINTLRGWKDELFFQKILA